MSGSKFHSDIPEMKRLFDRATKCAFRGGTDPQYIRFGTARDRDPKLRITAGKLRLEAFVYIPSILILSILILSIPYKRSRLDRKDVASFFEPSIKCIIDAVLAQCRTAHKHISVST